MTSDRLFRICGSALLAGAVLFIAHIVLRSLLTAGAEPATLATGPFWLPVNLLGLAGAALVMLGLPVMYAWMAARTGTIGLVGAVLLAVAWMFFGVFLTLYSILLLPWLAAEAPSLVAASAPVSRALVAAFMIGLLAWFVGAVLLAVPFLRRRIEPRWIGYLLLASAAGVVIGNMIIAPSGPASDLTINLLSNLGPVLLSVAIAYLGDSMRSGADAGASRHVAV
jgi:hypothetical protein